MKIDLQGWFHPEEGKWYQKQVGRYKKGWIIEVGCWKGLSISYLAPLLIGKPQRLWCVDNWKGSKDKYAKSYRKLLLQHKKSGKSVSNQFRINLRHLEIPHKILEMDSLKASTYFKDESCSLIFLDASHDFLSVISDLRAWWPKVKSRGILAGHDFSSEHPDLIKAVTSFSKHISIPLQRGPKTIYYFKKR